MTTLTMTMLSYNFLFLSLLMMVINNNALSVSEGTHSSSLILAFGHQEILSPIGYMAGFLPLKYALEPHLDTEVGDLSAILDRTPERIVLILSSVDYPVKPQRDILLHLKRRKDGYSTLPLIGISDNPQYIEMLKHAPLSWNNPHLHWFVKTPNFDHIGFSELVLKALSSGDSAAESTEIVHKPYKNL